MKTIVLERQMFKTFVFKMSKKNITDYLKGTFITFCFVFFYYCELIVIIDLVCESNYCILMIT